MNISTFRGEAIDGNLLAFYQAGGATSNNIMDAAVEYLIAKGCTGARGTHINDYWYEYFRDILGYYGSISSMMRQFWASQTYAFFCVFASDHADIVANQKLVTTLSSGRPLDGSSLLRVEDEPVVGEGLDTYGPYTNMLTYSEDFSNAVWVVRGTATKDSTSVLDPFGGLNAAQISDLQVTSSNDMYQHLTGIFTTGVDLTPSLWLRKVTETGKIQITSTNGTAYGRWHIDLALMGDGWELITKEHPAVTVSAEWNTLASAHNGLLIAGRTVSTLFTVQIFGCQLTETPYRLPYVKTEASVVSVPLNYSDADEGPKFQITPDDVGSVYTGPVIGSELVTNGDFDVDSDWTKQDGWSISNGIAVYTPDTGREVTQVIDTTSGSVYEITYDITEILIGGVGVYVLESSDLNTASYQTTVGEYTERFTATGVTATLRFRSLATNSSVSIDNVSVKEVARNMGMPLLLDALDGAARDNTELVTNGTFDTDTDWTKEIGWTIASGKATQDGTGVGLTGQLYQTFTVVNGTYYEVSFDLTDYTSGDMQVRMGGNSVSKEYLSSELAEGNTYIFRTIADGISGLFFEPENTFIGSIDNVSVKEISDAEGEMQVEWTPMSDYDVDILTINTSILSQVESNTSMLGHNRSNGDIRTYDQTNAATANNINWVANTEYLIKVIWGTHPTEGANVKQIIITDGTTTWSSTVIDFDGSFDPTDFFSIAYNNTYWQIIKSIKVYKEPQTWYA